MERLPNVSVPLDTWADNVSRIAIKIADFVGDIADSS
jgi:hypothetical protein